MKILLIGGTHFFGKVLVKKLLSVGHEVTLLTRGNNHPQEFWHKISHIQCDRTDYIDFKKKLKGKDFDVVIDNAAMNQLDEVSIIDVFATRINPPQYIFCSSVAVYDDWTNATVELKEPDASLELKIGNDWGNQYANDKRAAEKYLQQHHGLMKYTIMRPVVIEGPADPYKRTWFWIQRIQDRGPIILPANCDKTLYRHVSAEDVAQAFFLAVGNKNAFNQIYNVAGSEIMTIEQYVNYIAKILSCDPVKLCFVPLKALQFALPEYALPAFFENVRLIPSISKIEQELGFKPRETLTWLAETVENFKAEKTLSWLYDKRDKEIKLADQYVTLNNISEI